MDKSQVLEVANAIAKVAPTMMGDMYDMYHKVSKSEDDEDVMQSAKNTLTMIDASGWSQEQHRLYHGLVEGMTALTLTMVVEGELGNGVARAFATRVIGRTNNGHN